VEEIEEYNVEDQREKRKEEGKNSGEDDQTRGE
jgi:hypothetical protein